MIRYFEFDCHFYEYAEKPLRFFHPTAIKGHGGSRDLRIRRQIGVFRYLGCQFA
jgi:hypothetical protein